LTTVYAAGPRVSEVVLLNVADIDSQRTVIRVEQGKGGKDRYVVLSPQLLRNCDSRNCHPVLTAPRLNRK
jgi:integrase/recombinase XerD